MIPRRGGGRSGSPPRRRLGTTLLALPLLVACSAAPPDQRIGLETTPSGTVLATATASATADADAPVVLGQAVIIDLAVPWQPEHQQTSEQVRQQRRTISLAQDEVLGALGPHGRLRRELHETAQVALVVDGIGLNLLRSHPRVAAVHVDEAAPAG